MTEIETEIVWQRHYPAAEDAWAAFRGACPWGETPQHIDIAALADARWDIVRIVALLRDAYHAACDACDACPGPAPAPVRIVVSGGHGTVSYGQGRSSVEMCPYHSEGGWLLTIRGPVGACDSVSTRVVGAGGPPWDTTTRWSPGDGWRMPLDPDERAAWLREQLATP